MFSQYPADNYTAQDWNALVEIHSDAVEKISAAVNSDQMQAIVSQAGQAMSKIPTCDSRAQAVVNAWRSDHSMVLQQSGNQAVNEASAAEIYENALLAGSGITTSFTAEVHKDLTTPADQERITALALQVAEESLQSLSQLADAAAWADTLNGLSVRSLSEVTSSWQPTYEKAVQEAVPHTQNLTQELVESLRLRASLALEKQQAVAQLHMEYRSYDFTLYSDQGKRDLEEILHAGLSSIEAASTTGSIAGLLKKSQMDLQVIPDKVQEANPSPLPFADIKSDDWYYNAVLYVYKRKIMNGYSTTVFRPDRQVSRAHLAQILYNLEGRPAVAGSISDYQDTVPGAWYEDAVTWAVQNNILSGYADGFIRAYAKDGKVLIKGKFAPIVGRICMDQFMVDVTDIDDVKINDEVVLMGTQGENSITADDIAKALNTINYEVFCTLSKRVPRQYIRNGKVTETVKYV